MDTNEIKEKDKKFHSPYYMEGYHSHIDDVCPFQVEENINEWFKGKVDRKMELDMGIDTDIKDELPA